MKNFILVLGLLVNIDTFAYVCDSDHSMALLSKIKNDHVDVEIVEERGDKLYYSLQISFSKFPRELRSASNSIYLVATLPANKDSFARLLDLGQTVKDKKINHFCVRTSPSSYYRDLILPSRFILEYGQLPGIYDLQL